MADKMMRVARRDRFGKAQPLQLDNLLMGEVVSSQGRELPPGGVFESNVFDTLGLTKLAYYVSLDVEANYSVEVVEVVHNVGGAFHEKGTSVIVPGGLKGSTSGCVDIYSPYFKVIVRNLGSTTFRVGLYLYMK